MTNKKRILIVDDDVDVLDQLSTILSGDGYDVTTAQSEGEAEDALTRFRPDLALVDIMMEHRDSGFVLCHEIKTYYPGTPVVIFTSVTSTTGINFPLDTSDNKTWIKADALIDKPVRPDLLKREVRRLLAVPQGDT